MPKKHILGELFLQMTHNHTSYMETNNEKKIILNENIGNQNISCRVERTTVSILSILCFRPLPSIKIKIGIFFILIILSKKYRGTT